MFGSARKCSTITPEQDIGNLMNGVQFKCEAIPPLSPAGTDPLFPDNSSLVLENLIRFWYRTLNGYLSGAPLQEMESRIFVKSCGAQSRIDLSDPFSTTFTITIRSITGSDRTFTSDQSNPLEKVIASFWAAVFMGGLHYPYSHDIGNIGVKDITDNQNILNRTGISFNPQADTSADLKWWLSQNLKTAVDIINDDHPRDFIPERFNLNLTRCILSPTPFRDWCTARNDIENTLNSFHARYPNDLLARRLINMPRENEANGNQKIGLLHDSSRFVLSTPLLIRYLKSGSDYFWMMIRFSGRPADHESILPSDASQSMDYRSLDRFWNEARRTGWNETDIVLLMPDTLQKKIDIIRHEIDPDKIILFGSKARGNFHSRSDTDLAVSGGKTGKSLVENGAMDIVDLDRVDDGFHSLIKYEGVTVYEKSI